MSQERLDPEPSLTLGELARMPVEQRFALLLPVCRQDVRAALDELRAQFTADWPLVSVERIVWALSVNAGLTGEEIRATPMLTGRQKHRTTLAAELGEDLSWDEFWSWFAEDAGEMKDGRLSNLAQFALFVACERREDWQWPDDRPTVQQTATRAQAIVCGRYYQPLRNLLRSTPAANISNLDDLTQDVFLRVSYDYWQERARHRFLGTGGASALLARIGRNTVYSLWRSQGKRVLLPLYEEDENGSTREIDALGVDDGHVLRLVGSQQEERVRECLRRTQSDNEQRERNVLICEAVWFDDERQVDVARDFGISPPRVKQLLDSALKRMGGCLRASGITLRAGNR